MSEKRKQQTESILLTVQKKEGLGFNLLVATIGYRYGLADRVVKEMINQLILVQLLEVNNDCVFISEKRRLVLLKEAEIEKKLAEAASQEAGKDELSSKEKVVVEASAEADHFFENLGVPVE